MKYTKEEALSEIKRRSTKIRKEEAKKKEIILSAVSACLMLALVVVIGIFGGAGVVAGAGSAYGSFFISAESGGYVLVAIAAFLVGVIVTVVIKHRLKRENNEASGEEK